MATDIDLENEFNSDQALSTQTRRGLVTRPSASASPSLVAEQQRAITEIQAALTVAQSFPRDEGRALDRILTSCQRPGVASEAEYEYSRGGESITGPTIKLMEVIAQNWTNIEFGFRELARFTGTAGSPGESVVEAFAWDLQTNVRRKVQFTVRHALGTKKGLKILTDPRDIYELLANQAQRRVRTCLENIIPRDIADAAVEECRQTMLANEEVTPERLQKLLGAFAGFGVTKEHIETRLQRRLDTMSPAQMVRMKRIFSSIRDGMGEPGDYFDLAAKEPEKTVADKAKDALKSRAKPKPAPEVSDQVKEPAAGESASHGSDSSIEQGSAETRENEYTARLRTIQAEIDAAKDSLQRLDACAGMVTAEALDDPDASELLGLIAQHKAALRGGRGERSNKPKDSQRHLGD